MPTVSLSPRDDSLLRLLSWTPATTAQLWQASVTFAGERFPDERRLRERLQALTDAGILRAWSTAHSGGGLQKYFKLTPEGFALACGPEAPLPPRAFFAAVTPSLYNHTFRLAEVIVTILCACHARHIEIVRFIRENELTFTVGAATVQPDGFFRLRTSGLSFNLALEIDNSTESVESSAENSVRQKLVTYDGYQELLLAAWLKRGRLGERPRIRVAFLPPTVQRTHHILACAADTTQYPTRQLVYAAPFDTFVTDPDPLYAPLFLDHGGHWQSLIDLYPAAPFLRAPVRLVRPLESLLPV